VTSVTLADLARDPGRASEVSIDAIPGLLGEVERLKATLWARLASPHASRPPAGDGERLLTVEQAAERLGTSVDWLYRHAAGLPFTVRLAARQLRFSAAGIDRYIRYRAGH
jgi:predicted DNA-binding transcriptional regulator AlpA